MKGHFLFDYDAVFQHVSKKSLSIDRAFWKGTYRKYFLIFPKKTNPPSSSVRDVYFE